MLTLGSLKNSTREYKRNKRVGRGPGSGRGKTCGRGEKGAGSRSGYKRRWGYEGGQFRLYMKLPIRGFSNERFRTPMETVNLQQIEAVYKDGEVVNEVTLAEKGLISGRIHGIKLLGKGDLKKNVKIHIDAISAGAREKLQAAKIDVALTKKSESENA